MSNRALLWFGAWFALYVVGGGAVAGYVFGLLPWHASLVLPFCLALSAPCHDRMMEEIHYD